MLSRLTQAIQSPWNCGSASGRWHTSLSRPGAWMVAACSAAYSASAVRQARRDQPRRHALQRSGRQQAAEAPAGQPWAQPTEGWPLKWSARGWPSAQAPSAPLQPAEPQHRDGVPARGWPSRHAAPDTAAAAAAAGRVHQPGSHAAPAQPLPAAQQAAAMRLRKKPSTSEPYVNHIRRKAPAVNGMPESARWGLPSPPADSRAAVAAVAAPAAEAGLAADIVPGRPASSGEEHLPGSRAARRADNSASSSTSVSAVNPVPLAGSRLLQREAMQDLQGLYREADAAAAGASAQAKALGLAADMVERHLLHRASRQKLDWSAQGTTAADDAPQVSLLPQAPGAGGALDRVQLTLHGEEFAVQPVWIAVYQPEGGPARLYESICPLDSAIVSHLSQPLEPFCEVADLTFSKPDTQAGAWANYLIGVIGDVAAQEEDVLWPNQMFHGSRVMYNVRNGEDIARFLADPAKERIEEHLVNLRRLQTDRDYRVGWCWHMLRARWGVSALQEHAVDVQAVQPG